MVLPPITEKKFTEGFPKLKICVTGAGGFIASHLARRLKAEGHFVRGVDWKENEHMAQDTFCDEFMLLDCRFPENCKKAVEGCEWCFNLAVRSLLVWRSPACEGAWRVWRVRGPVFPVARLCQSGEVGCVWKGCTPQAVLHILCRPTWAAWASFSPITLASSTTPR